jgi:hypothetical protein
LICVNFVMPPLRHHHDIVSREGSWSAYTCRRAQEGYAVKIIHFDGLKPIATFRSMELTAERSHRGPEDEPGITHRTTP